MGADKAGGAVAEPEKKKKKTESKAASARAVSSTDDPTNSEAATGSPVECYEPIAIKLHQKVDDPQGDSTHWIKATRGCKKGEWILDAWRDIELYPGQLCAKVKCSGEQCECAQYAHIEISITTVFGQKVIYSVGYGNTQPLGNWQKLVDKDMGYLDHEGRMILEAEIAFPIRNVSLHCKQCHHDFSTPSIRTNGMLIVEGKKLHVKLEVLALASPVFAGLFSDNEKIFNIEKVTFKDFVPFLAHLCAPHLPCFRTCPTPTISVGDVESMLALAMRFHAKAVCDMLEQYVLESDQISPQKKLQLADYYNLHDLMNWCFRILDSVEKIKQIMETTEFEQTSTATKTRFLKNLMEH